MPNVFLPRYCYHLAFCLVVSLFVYFQSGSLHDPYFWDELGVYSRSSAYLADHGLSMMPSALPPELSRGHPLFFPLLFGAVFLLFGKKVVVARLFALCISVTLLGVVYRKLGKHSSYFGGLLTVILLVCQPVFVAQSTMILPEILLTLFCFLALFSFIEKKYLSFALFSTLGILTKESAIVVPAVAVFLSLVNALSNRQSSGDFFKTLPLLLSPILAFSLFLIVQKKQNGWFFFPLHIDSVSFDWNRFLSQNHSFRNFILFDQGRYWWVKVLLIGAALGIAKHGLKLKNDVVAISVLFLVAFLTFSSMNFYMNRYMLPMFPLLVWLVLVSASQVSKNKYLIGVIVVILSALSLKDLDTGHFNYDCDLSYKRHLLVEQKVIDNLCKLTDETKHVSANFPVGFAIFESRSGFRLCPHINYHSEITPATKYIAQTSHAPGVEIPVDSKIVYKIESKDVTGEIWETPF